MRGLLIATLASAAVLSAVPAYANDAAAEGAGVDAKDKMICKRTQRTGTRFYTQICKTAAQWDALSEQHRRDAKEMVDRPQIEIRRE